MQKFFAPGMRPTFPDKKIFFVQKIFFDQVCHGNIFFAQKNLGNFFFQKKCQINAKIFCSRDASHLSGQKSFFCANSEFRPPTPQIWKIWKIADSIFPRNIFSRFVRKKNSGQNTVIGIVSNHQNFNFRSIRRQKIFFPYQIYMVSDFAI